MQPNGRLNPKTAPLYRNLLNKAIKQELVMLQNCSAEKHVSVICAPSSTGHVPTLPCCTIHRTVRLPVWYMYGTPSLLLRQFS